MTVAQLGLVGGGGGGGDRDVEWVTDPRDWPTTTTTFISHHLSFSLSLLNSPRSGCLGWLRLNANCQKINPTLNNKTNIPTNTKPNNEGEKSKEKVMRVNIIYSFDPEKNIIILFLWERKRSALAYPFRVIKELSKYRQ